MTSSLHIFSDFVTMQVDYSNSDDLEEIWENIQRVAKTCSKLNEFAVEGKLGRFIKIIYFGSRKVNCLWKYIVGSLSDPVVVYGCFYLWNTELIKEFSNSVLSF